MFWGTWVCAVKCTIDCAPKHMEKKKKKNDILKWKNPSRKNPTICVNSLQCESTYGWPVGWNIWMTWHTCCKDVSLLCPRSDLFSSYCLLTITEENLSPLFIWSVRPLKKSTMYHLHHDSVVVRLFFTVWFIKSPQIAKIMLFFKIL